MSDSGNYCALNEIFALLGC